MQDIYFPLWYNQKVDITTTEDRFPFNVTYKGKVVYSGTAIKNPATGKVTIGVTDIVLSAFSYPAMEWGRQEDQISGRNLMFGDGVPPVFMLNDGVNPLFALHPVYDYSFQNLKALQVAQKRLLSRPLRNDGVIDVDSRQILTISQWSEELENLSISIDGGVTKFNERCMTAWMDLSKAEKGSVSATGAGGQTQKYEVYDGCAEFVLHYLNSIGGWDSVIITKGVPRQAYNRKNISTGRNEDLANYRDDITYANEVRREWTLNTAWMTKDAGSNIAEVVGSNLCFLEDLNFKNEADRLIAVNIQNRDVDMLNYHLNNMQLVSFEIEVAESQRRVRR